MATRDASIAGRRPVDYVNPFICTQGDHGQWHPAAMVPFGMVQLCPDTYPGSLTANGDFAHSGYDYSDSQLRGFSHFHKGSSGGTAVCDRAGRLSIVPFVGEPDHGFYEEPVLDFDKASEKARAGFYSVRLSRDDILVELTATTHAGCHRYTFPSGKAARLFIFEGNRTRSKGISFEVTGPTGICGLQVSYAGIHFVMELGSPLRSTRFWNGSKLDAGSLQGVCPGGGLVCDFGDLGGKPLEVRVGVSMTSLEAARRNLGVESPGLGFPAIRDRAEKLWNDTLGLIEVEGNEEYKTIFYTALYHTCFLPVALSDADGTYPGLDRKTHRAEGYTHYGEFAFWDSFRTAYPLYGLYLPGVYSDVVTSLRDIYEQADNWEPFPHSDHRPHGSGFLAKGKDGYQAFGTCRHEHMLMVMTDAYFKGLFRIELESIYPHIRREAMVQMPEEYDEIGYIPARPDQTGEYCWDSWCVAKLARELGKQDDVAYFDKRSRYWRNTWDPEILFFRARAADGTWLDFPEDPTVNREKYTYEGTKWQWRWNIVHDVPGLVAVLQGRERFVRELEYFFEHDLYTAGNQPDLQAPFLFNPAGSPWLTQKWVHRILTEPVVQKYGTHNLFPEPIYGRVYKATPDGYLLEMDDDYGCMSAWYAMAAMGLYQLCPGNPVYQLSSPIFERVKIKLDRKVYKGREFTIEARDLSAVNHYIQSATLNGKPLDRSYLSHDEIARGGTLVYVMGPAPNTAWGVSPDPGGG